MVLQMKRVENAIEVLEELAEEESDSEMLFDAFCLLMDLARSQARFKEALEYSETLLGRVPKETLSQEQKEQLVHLCLCTCLDSKLQKAFARQLNRGSRFLI